MKRNQSLASNSLEFAENMVVPESSGLDSEIQDFYTRYFNGNNIFQAEITDNEVLEGEGKKFVV